MQHKSICLLFFLILMIYSQAQIATVTTTPLMVLGESNCRAIVTTPNNDGVVMAIGKDIWISEMKGGSIIGQLRGHKEPINSLAISKSGKYIASASGDKTIKIWDLSTQQLIKTFQGHESVVTSVDFSPDESKIVSGSMDNTVKIWSLNKNRPLMTLLGHTDWVTAVAFSSSGDYVLTGSNDKTARLWSIRQKSQMILYSNHVRGVTGVEFSKDGNNIYTISNDSRLRSFFTMTGQLDKQIPVPGRTLLDIELSSDGRKLAVTNSDKVTIFDVKKWKGILDYEGHQSVVNQIAFTSDNNFLVSSSLDKTVKLWDVNKGNTYQVFLEKKIPYQTGIFANARKETITGTVDGKIQIWSLQTGSANKIFKAHDSEITALAVSENGNYLLSGSTDKLIKLWNLETGDLVKIFVGHKGTITALVFVDDKSMLSVSEDKTARKWDIASGQLFRKEKIHNSFVTGLELLPDKKQFITCSEDRLLKIWDIHSFELKKTIEGHKSFITNMAISPNGREVLTTTWEGELALWNIESGRKIYSYEGHTAPVSSMAFSPDGIYFLTGSKDKSARLWHKERQEIIEIFNGHSDEITAVDCSADGQYILTASKDNYAKIWLGGLDMEQGNNSEITTTSVDDFLSEIDDCKTIKPLKNDEIIMAWHSPSERKYRDTNYSLNDDFLNIEIEIETQTPIEKSNLTLLINGLKGGKFGETSIRDYSKDGASVYFYSFESKVKFSKPGKHCLQLEYSKNGEVLATSAVITVEYEPEKINLYLLTIGTNPVDLKFPLKDAKDFAELFDNQSLFKKVYTRKLLAEEATATRIKLEMSKLQKNRFITNRDLVMVFISSHGFIRHDGKFCLQASDYDLIDPVETSIAFNEISSRLNDLNCKKILFMDACHSGVADPHLLIGKKDNSSTAARSALKKLLVKTDGWLMITSSGDEPSWEHEDWENGSFTEAIIKALADGEADTNNNNLVSIKEFYEYLTKTVASLNASVNFPPQSPQITNTLGDDLEFYQIRK